ncbi:urease accessory protein UreD [Gordonia rubripertincta]|uniref:Urease accessory protein UreD n=1 Tax=Gordonia rubripertincta TaxID=36822 RepID=A0ABT4MV60_GORRU|nr:urease accessory protein UreD [Gordonia rubripertincta]MCZ4550887.1 urease accessory protein UreD [Gordonia rubripertincta]
MHTELHVRAVKGRSPRIRASGGIAVRQTGVDTLHMISSAATPLGGDLIEINVEVGPGACLNLHSVAAAMALPGPHEPRSELRWHIAVADGARLVIDPQPTIVAAHAVHHSETAIDVAESGAVRMAERVQIGRSSEDLGRWTGRVRADVGGTPAVRHQVSIGRPEHDELGAPAVLFSEFRYPDERPDAVHPDAVGARLGLAAGGSLTTVLARTLNDAERWAGDLDG